MKGERSPADRANKAIFQLVAPKRFESSLHTVEAEQIFSPSQVVSCGEDRGDLDEQI